MGNEPAPPPGCGLGRGQPGGAASRLPPAMNRQASGLKSKHLGSPPYKFALAPSRVLGAPEGQKIVRGTVKVSRPGEQEQTFQWDVYMRKVPGSNPERWRLWTVADTPK